MALADGVKGMEVKSKMRSAKFVLTLLPLLPGGLAVAQTPTAQRRPQPAQQQPAQQQPILHQPAQQQQPGQDQKQPMVEGPAQSENPAKELLPPPIVTSSRVLSLHDAVQTARGSQPQLWQARANTAVAQARADEARAPILPQLTGTASYQRATANFVLRPGSVPSSIMTGTQTTTFDTFNFFSFGLQLSQYIWDFGQTTNRWQAAKVNVDALRSTERVSTIQVLLGVRTAYFGARAQKALIGVARDNLTNQERHLQQVQGFVTVGTRPEIDLAQARTDRANAQVQLITAVNNYEIAKAQLNQAMGVEQGTDYDVQDESLAPIAGEEDAPEALLDEAVRARPDLATIERQIAAQKLIVKANKGGYGPALNANMGLTDSGTDITRMGWNWNATVSLNWGLFQGLLTYSQVKEAEATLRLYEAQLATARQQVRVDVEQARLQVRAAKATLSASAEALANARERLRLAEARYKAGVGSIIELGDAQVAMVTASGQSVQAEYSLATARAQLHRALGRLE